MVWMSGAVSLHTSRNPEPEEATNPKPRTPEPLSALTTLYIHTCTYIYIHTLNPEYPKYLMCVYIHTHISLYVCIYPRHPKYPEYPKPQLRRPKAPNLYPRPQNYLSYSLNSLKRFRVWGYIGEYIRDYYRGYQGDTRSLDYSSPGDLILHGLWAQILSTMCYSPNP